VIFKDIIFFYFFFFYVVYPMTNQTLFDDLDVGPYRPSGLSLIHR
jgi:hypothetical protein